MNTLSIPIAFCLLFVVLLWFVIGAKGHWLLKTFAIFICTYFSIVVWFSLYSYLGWPCKDSLPEKYMIYWAQIEEPSPATEGAIYFWITELESKKNNYFLNYINEKNEPRIYKIPYSRPLHKNVQDMVENIKKGSVYVGGKKDKETKKHNNPLEGRGQFGFSHKSKDHYLYPLPSPKIPEKMK